MRKRIYSILLAALAAMSAGAQTLFTIDERFRSPRKEVRAMWLTTLSGLDWPGKPARSAAGAEDQQKELCAILDQLQQAGINTVLFQTRIRATTAYPSAIEPWDEVFTGIAGQAPLYDPLKFAVEECHKRGMELHAWVVAFPICKTRTARTLGKKALPSRHPEMCQRCGDQWMMDPGVPETGDYIARICKEIVSNYPVDGIHLDYIRYPEQGIPFNDARTFRKYGKGQDKDEWRRANVTSVVRKIHKAIKEVRPWVKLSCSPVGKHADLAQQSSYGWNARYAVHQDAQAWLREGIMDILFPMMYFDGKHFYPFAIDWQDNSYGRQIVPGLGIYFLDKRQKDWELDVIRRQMFFTRSIGAAGQAHFRSRFFTDNVKGLYDFAAGDFYSEHVPVPPMSWADSIPPTMPDASISARDNRLEIKWQPSHDNHSDSAITYNVYFCETHSFHAETAQRLAWGLKTCEYAFEPILPERRNGHYAVTATDVFGNESGGKAITTFSPVASSMQVVPLEGYLTVPDVDKAEFLLITDLSHRHIKVIPYSNSAYVGDLAPGFYQIRTLAEKGISHPLFPFWKQ